MSGHYLLDANHQPYPVDLMTWAKAFEHDPIRRVAFTQVSDDVEVSTVFLGLDHSFGDGPPVLWETMIFGGEHDGYQDRYRSHADALVGHEAAVALVKGVA